MALHALAYCERLFYLEEVEEIRLADDRVHAGRELHAALEDADERVESLEVSHPGLGLTGRVDGLRRRDGRLVAYEHKRGRCRRGPDGEPQAWKTDAVQATAYAMMLEHTLGQPVEEARVRYHADNVTVRLTIDRQARDEVERVVARANQLRSSTQRPPVTENENLCKRCSLAPACLPEESRQVEDPSRKPSRLFPAEDLRTSLHVVTRGAEVRRSGETFLVRSPEGDEHKVASVSTGAVVLHGSAQITTQAIRLCTERDVAVHWVTEGGRFVGSLTTTAGQVQRRVRQYTALADAATRLRLARTLVTARLAGQHAYLKRATRGDDASRASAKPALLAISAGIENVASAADTDSLRGTEGAATAAYWSAFNTLLTSDAPPELRFVGRSRRPAGDRISALLNFGYALLQSAVMRAILAAGLEPALGFYHTPRSAAHPLVLDLMELFRVPLWDMPLVASLNRRQWRPDTDFRVTRTAVWLSDEGRRKAIGLFEERLRERWKHPVLGYSLSYARTIELEARLLEKEWSGEPGLFARLRLR